MKDVLILCYVTQFATKYTYYTIPSPPINAILCELNSAHLFPRKVLLTLMPDASDAPWPGAPPRAASGVLVTTRPESPVTVSVPAAPASPPLPPSPPSPPHAAAGTSWTTL